MSPFAARRSSCVMCVAVRGSSSSLRVCVARHMVGCAHACIRWVVGCPLRPFSFSFLLFLSLSLSLSLSRSLSLALSLSLSLSLVFALVGPQPLRASLMNQTPDGRKYRVPRLLDEVGGGGVGVQGYGLYGVGCCWQWLLGPLIGLPFFA